ncbi:hypothetical protein [Streptosporangium subroseum]|nr:hypothetical protein [Streptosporangium subroseum]
MTAAPPVIAVLGLGVPSRVARASQEWLAQLLDERSHPETP